MDIDRKQHINESVRTLLVLAASLLMVGAGSTLFFSDFAYRDYNQLWVYVGFLAFCAASFFVTLRQKYALTILMVLLGMTTLWYSTLKYDWRRAYVTSHEQNKPFFLEAYIQDYPSFESHLFGRYFGEPDPVGLANDCLLPMSVGQKPEREACASFRGMQDAYNMDVHGMMMDQYEKMRSTAKKIKEGKLHSTAEYQSCIASKECAPIPLLPSDVKAESIDINSNTQYYTVRKAFWSLVNEHALTKEICAYMPLCGALVKGGLLPPENPGGVSIQ